MQYGQMIDTAHRRDLVNEWFQFRPPLHWGQQGYLPDGSVYPIELAGVSGGPVWTVDDEEQVFLVGTHQGRAEVDGEHIAIATLVIGHMLLVAVNFPDVRDVIGAWCPTIAAICDELKARCDI